MTALDDKRCAWPKHLLLEVTNTCDLWCRHCHCHGDGVVKQRPVDTKSEDTDITVRGSG
jgi:hypothetical protein